MVSNLVLRDAELIFSTEPAENTEEEWIIKAVDRKLEYLHGSYRQLSSMS